MSGEDKAGLASMRKFILLALLFVLFIGGFALIPQYREPGKDIPLQFDSDNPEQGWQIENHGQEVSIESNHVTLTNTLGKKPVSIRHNISLPPEGRNFRVRAEVRGQQDYRIAPDTLFPRVAFVGVDEQNNSQWKFFHNLVRMNFPNEWQKFERVFVLPEEIRKAALIIQSGDGIGAVEVRNISIQSVEATGLYKIYKKAFLVLALIAFWVVCKTIYGVLSVRGKIIITFLMAVVLSCSLLPGKFVFLAKMMAVDHFPAMTELIKHMEFWVGIEFDHVLHFVTFAVLAVGILILSAQEKTLDIFISLSFLSVLIEAFQFFSVGREISMIDASAGILALIFVCGGYGIYKPLKRPNRA